ncbi:MAG: hypothetical protein ABI630_10845 [Betaproteobacteria bacterium]
MRIVALLNAATLAALSAAVVVPAFAKLPPPSPEAQAKAAETAAKSAWTDKVGAYKVCLAQDRAVQSYRAGNKGTTQAAAIVPGAANTGMVSTPAVAMATCMDPGPFTYTPAANKPLEASGAHSPPGAAVSPPSSKANAAEIAGGVKKPAPN